MVQRGLAMFWLGCLGVALMSTANGWAQVSDDISTIIDPIGNGTNFNCYILIEQIVGPDTSPVTSLVTGLISATNNNEVVPLTVVIDDTAEALYFLPITVPPDVLAETFTLTWTNTQTQTEYSSPLTVGEAEFAIAPTNETVLVNQTVTLTAHAFHTSGYQWQQNGTNLVDDGHFSGTTNATLTIVNAQLSDAGTYTVTAGNTNGTASASLSLGVFKPLGIGLAALRAGGGVQLSVTNLDGSPFATSQLANLSLYSTTDLTLPFADWNLETAGETVSNGVLWIVCPDDGSPAKFWTISQQ